jgi:hypothetical protein
LDKKRINIINLSVLDKIIDFLKPWTYVMKRVQSAYVPSIHTVTPSISIINSSLEIKGADAKQEKGIRFHYLFCFSILTFILQVLFFFVKELNRSSKK